MRKSTPVEDNSLEVDRTLLKRLRVSEALEGLSLRMVAAPATPITPKRKARTVKTKSDRS